MERIYENAVFNCMMPTISNNFDNSPMPIMEIYDYQDNRGYRRATWALEVLIQSFETEFNNNLGEFGEKYKTQIVERFKRAWQKEEYYSAQIEKWKSERKDVIKQIREVRQELLKTSEEEKNIYRDIDKQYGEQFLCYNDMIENAEAALYLIDETQLIMGHNQRSETNNRENNFQLSTKAPSMYDIKRKATRVFATIYVLGKLGIVNEVFLNKTQDNKFRIENAIAFVENEWGEEFNRFPLDTIWDYAKPSKKNMFGNAFLEDDLPIVKEFLAQKIPDRENDISLFLMELNRL